jgi:DNA invertase Pin-like site-specific DNA recombinase
MIHAGLPEGHGARDRRPAWNECWDALQKGKINVLLVHALDRMGRSLANLVKVLATLIERQITLISYRENIDLSTAAGRLLANLISVLADFELALICERTAAGMRAAKARGSKIGNQKRFFDKVEATRLRDQGWGKVRIARQLRVGVGTVHRWCREEYQPPGLRNGHHED